MDCSLPGSSVRGIFQAVVLEWVAVSLSSGSSRPRHWTQVSRIVDRRLTVWATRELSIHPSYLSIYLSYPSIISINHLLPTYPPIYPPIYLVRLFIYSSNHFSIPLTYPIYLSSLSLSHLHICTVFSTFPSEHTKLCMWNLSSHISKPKCAA